MIPIVGGVFEGPRLRGTILRGGADWQLSRPDGVLELEARYVLRVDDGTHIAIRNAGVMTAADDGGAPYVRTVASFDAPRESSHAWLSRAIFVGTVALDRGPGAINVRVRIFQVL